MLNAAIDEVQAVTTAVTGPAASENTWSVVVHAGAGYHSTSHEQAYRLAMVQACKAAAAVLECGGKACDAAMASIMVLENHEITNAGLGSNLTESGHVEADAAMMDGKTVAFGSVAAARGIENPIQLAAQIMREESLGRLPLGRVRPIMLTGDGARVWARTRGIPVAPDHELETHHVTERARRTWLDHKSRVFQEQQLSKRHLSVAVGLGDAQAEVENDAPLLVAVEHHLPVITTAATSTTSATTAAATTTATRSKSPLTPSSRLRKRSKPDGIRTIETAKRSRRRLEEGEDGASDEDGNGTITPARPASLSTDHARYEGVLGENRPLTQGDAGTDTLWDTVGAVCMDISGNIAAGVSSGGISLKCDGRVGEAALFGCGCFATPLDANGNSAGVSVSGTGEEVTRSLLAFEAARKLRFYASGITASFPDMITNPLVPPTCNLNHAFHPPSVQFTDHVPAIPAVVAAVAGGPTTGSTPATTIHDISSIEGDSPPTTISSPCSSCECSGSEYDAEPEPWTPLQQLLQSFLDFKGPESLCCPASQSGCRSTDERAAGVVGLISHERGSVADVVWSHTTPSFAVGFLNSGDAECTAFISRRSIRQSVAAGGTTARLRRKTSQRVTPLSDSGGGGSGGGGSSRNSASPNLLPSSSRS